MFPFLKKEAVIRFRFEGEVSRKRLTWDDLVTLQLMGEGEVKPLGLMNLAARFMTDENGQYLDHKAAVKILGGLAEDERADVLKKFLEALNGSALPNGNGRQSNLPSQASSQASLSPDGS